jgi:hypothetical protein
MANVHKLEANESAEKKVDEVSRAIEKLIRQFARPEEQDEVLRRVTDRLRPIPAPRAGDVLEALVISLPRRREWTVEEIKTELVERGVSAKPKEVYNAIGYLARKNHIRRVGYGRYVVDGVEVVTSDDLGGENSRHEDAYRVDRT